MAKKEFTAETLAARLEPARATVLKDAGRVAALEGKLAELEEENRALGRQAVREGADVSRAQAKVAEAIRETRELLRAAQEHHAAMAKELEKLEAEHAAAEQEAKRARTPVWASRLQAGTSALAGQLRDLLAAPLGQLQELEGEHQALCELWEEVYGTEFLGGHPLRQLGHSLRQLQATLDGIGGPR
jgi:chromosome segregation ATPase